MGSKLGDETALLTWARYQRWPMLAVILLLLGLVLGLFFAGLEGAVIGAVGGAVLGLVLGLVMGKDSQMFPMNVELWIAAAGDKPTYAGLFPGRVTTQRFTDENAGFVEKRVTEFLSGMTLKKLSNFSLPTWFKEEKGWTLPVLQVDSFNFLALTWKNGVLVAFDVPVYKTKMELKEGQYLSSIDVDEKGVPIIDHLEKRVLLDTTVMSQDGNLVKIPTGLAAKLDNDRVTLTNNVRIAAAFNKTGGFWDKWGKSLLDLVVILVILTVVILGFQNLSGFADKIAGATTQAVVAASANNLAAAKLNAQIAEAMLRLGYNYNANFTVAVDTPAPPVQGSGGSFTVPFIG